MEIPSCLRSRITDTTKIRQYNNIHARPRLSSRRQQRRSKSRSAPRPRFGNLPGQHLPSTTGGIRILEPKIHTTSSQTQTAGSQIGRRATRRAGIANEEGRGSGIEGGVRQQQSSGRSGVVDQGGVFFDGETRQAAGGDDASFASGAFAVGFGEDDPSADEDEVERLPLNAFVRHASSTGKQMCKLPRYFADAGETSFPNEVDTRSMGGLHFSLLLRRRRRRRRQGDGPTRRRSTSRPLWRIDPIAANAPSHARVVHPHPLVDRGRTTSPKRSFVADGGVGRGTHSESDGRDVGQETSWRGQYERVVTDVE
mmetsp:Transcript_14404/g.29729  ORF Transcript_14404/g.29729 Transcript_14404/m.29729 type:complete len:311 (+) Transcript_14404:240-1172(+)